MVDSQADISIIKSNCVPKRTPIDNTDLVRIQGVTTGFLTSIGSIHFNLLLEKLQIPHLFHIVDDSFPIPTDGIIGKDFLRQYKCSINYEHQKFSIYFQNIQFQVPILNSDNVKVLYVPPRCEILRCIDASNIQTPVIISEKLSDGLYTAGSVSNSNKAIIRIINTSEHTRTVNINDKKIHSINDFDILNEQTTDVDYFNKTRLDKVKTILQRQIPDHVSEDALKLCME